MDPFNVSETPSSEPSFPAPESAAPETPAPGPETPASEADSPETAERLTRMRSFLVEMAQTAILALLLFLAIDTATARIRVQSISMQPTLYERDFVLVNKLAYRMGELHRKDVVVFHPPLNQVEEPYIKRVIGLPGDTVRIAGGNVYVNDQLQQESYLKAAPNYNGIWSVPEGQVFVLGDNRNNSSDSHQWGMVPTSNLMGKALVVYWPLDHWKLLDQATASAAAP